MMNKRFNNKGFAFEFVLIIVVAVILLGGVYLYSLNTKQEGSLAKNTAAPTSKVSPKTEQIENLTPSPTPLPTVTEIKTDTGDAVVDQAAGELNTLLNEVNALDQLDSDLNLPSVDFSSDF